MPLPIMALVGMAASAYAAKKQRDSQEKASRESAAGQAQAAKSGGADAFGENTHAGLLEQMDNTGVQQQFQAPPQPMAQPPAPLAAGGPAIAQIAPPQQPIQQPKPAETYSQGVDAPNIAPNVGGATGGDISKIATPDIFGADAAMANQPSPLTSTGPEGGYQALPQGTPPPPPPAGGQRMQDFMGVAGPAAGMIGAGVGAANSAQRAPGSGGFPARGGWNMPPSLAVAAQYNRRRR